MMSHDNSSYDGFSSNSHAASYGGGGFSSGGASAAAAAASSSSGKKQYDDQSLIAVNCKLASEAVEKMSGRYYVGPNAIYAPQVQCIANVLSVTSKETHAEIDIEDGSGTIQVRQYIDVNDPPLEIREGKYHKFHGKIRKIDGRMCISAFISVPVEDMNEFTKHSLEVILLNAKAAHAARSNAMDDSGETLPTPLPSASQQPQQRANASAAASAASAVASSAHSGNFSMTTPPARVGGGAGASAALPSSAVSRPKKSKTGDPVRDAILEAFGSGPNATSDSGNSILDVAQRLSSTISLTVIMSSIERLCNEGHLYSTVDEDHYKTTQ